MEVLPRGSVSSCHRTGVLEGGRWGETAVARTCCSHQSILRGVVISATAGRSRARCRGGVLSTAGQRSSSKGVHVFGVRHNNGAVVSLDRLSAARDVLLQGEDEEEGSSLGYAEQKGLAEVVQLTASLVGEGAAPGPQSPVSELTAFSIEKTGTNKRRIAAQICVEAPLEAVWQILTSYNRLADYIPGLAVSELLEKGEDRALIRQVGRQELAFGFTFQAEAVMQVKEYPLQTGISMRRDLEFEMVEGDFERFSGTWNLAQDRSEAPQTVLSYTLEVQPKAWLPVRLLEGRLRKDIGINLVSVRNAAVSSSA